MTEEVHEALMGLDDLDAVTAADKPFEFEYIHPTRGKCGVFLQVIGDESTRVRAAVNLLVNDMRKANAKRAADAAEAALLAGDKPEPVFTPVEDDIASGNEHAAIRLVGWRGLKEKWSPENALRAVSRNSDLKSKVLGEAAKLANFM